MFQVTVTYILNLDSPDTEIARHFNGYREQRSQTRPVVHMWTSRCYLQPTITYLDSKNLPQIRTYTHRFNSYFLDKPGLASNPVYSQSPVIHVPCILTGWVKTLHTRMVLRAVPHPLTLTASVIQGESFFYGPDALPVTKPTAPKHWRQQKFTDKYYSLQVYMWHFLKCFSCSSSSKIWKYTFYSK